jgi:thiamine kinase-like enzyme
MNYRQQAINLFCSKTSYQKDAIKSCAPIHKGFTNVSYKITLKNHDIFQVRIANDGHQVKRHNEYKVCRMIKFPYFIYYDLKTGNAIKRWIKGSNPSKKIICSAQFLQAFNKSLIKLHDHIVKNNQVLQHDYYDCLKKAKLPTKHRNAYLTLIKKYLAMPLVLSHNDLSADNLIYTPNHEVVFIDYE